jgi:predicted aspartyl protease
MTLQFQSLTTKFNGRTLVPGVQVEICEAFDPASTAQPTQARQYNVIWDTGATNTVISNKVVSDLGLKPIGRVTTQTANGLRDAMTCLVNVKLPNNTMIVGLRVTEGDLVGVNIDGLIGMDIITMGDFAITNCQDITWISFRMPSIKRIDYVEEANQLNVQAAKAAADAVKQERKRQQREFRAQTSKKRT